MPEPGAGRRALQAELDRRKSLAARNRLGQFATPDPLACAIAASALALLPQEAPLRFLDPAFGLGAFYDALLKTAAEKKPQAALGFEIDPHYGAPAAALWQHSGLELRQVDFTTASPPMTDVERATLLLCNPPYVRHHHLARTDKTRLTAALAAEGVSGAGMAGLYGYFLVLGQRWLAMGGIAAWLVPAEFLDVNYGVALKRYLLDRVTLLRIHRFDPGAVQFGDALVSSCVVWLRNAPPPAGHRVEFSFGDNLERPRLTRHYAVSTLDAEAKWSRLSETAVKPVPVCTLGELFTIRRGLATGGNRFFILSPEQIAARGLPPDQFRPLLPGPRDLTSDEVAADAEGLPLLPRPRFLLDCRLSEAQVHARHPALWDYLEQGRATVGAGYLCRHRQPWYAQEQRLPPPLLCSYMGRGRPAAGSGPFRFLLNHSCAVATNVYLLLYPRPALQERIVRNPEILRTLWRALCALDGTLLTNGGRIYGGGLYKLEPKELSSVDASSIMFVLNDS